MDRKPNQQTEPKDDCRALLVKVLGTDPATVEAIAWLFSSRVPAASRPGCPACKTDGYQYTCEDCWRPS